MHKLYITTIIIVINLYGSFAQNSGVSVEFHYPITFANENNNYSDIKGIFGGAFQFQFTDNEIINYGIEYKFDFNQSYQRYQYSTTNDSFNFMMNHINGFAKVNVDLLQRTKIYTNAGFTFYKYKEGADQQGFTGVNIGAGLNYEFVEKFYAQLSYDYIYAGMKEKQTGFIDKENFNALRIGLGFKL